MKKFLLPVLFSLFAACEDSSSGSLFFESSSSEAESSSVRMMCPENLPDDYICDPRDYEVYRTVNIGALVWTAENIRFNVEGSLCYQDQDSNCVKLGRLYNWSQGMGFESKFLRNYSEDQIKRPYHQGICMPGWHIPDTLEWKYLFNYTDVGEVDPYGFNLVYGGMYNIYFFTYWFREAHYFSSTESDELDYYVDRQQDSFFNPDVPPSRVYRYIVYPDRERYDSESKSHAISLRCVKDTLLMEMIFSSNTLVELSSSSIESSSSSVELSSSSVESSSSESVCAYIEKENWKYLNPDIEYEVFEDERDGNCYKSVLIGDLIWMAENLNYADSSTTPVLIGANYCIGGNSDSCQLYGRFYTHMAALEVCPNGWRLPTLADFKDLQKNASDPALKSTGWEWKNSPATNTSGFSALPVGIYVNEKVYCSVEDECEFTEGFSGYGNLVNIWLESVVSGINIEHARYIIMWDSDKSTDRVEQDFRIFGMNVRCVKQK